MQRNSSAILADTYVLPDSRGGSTVREAGVDAYRVQAVH